MRPRLQPTPQSIQAKMRLAAEKSGLTLEEIGIRMKKRESIAKQSVQRLLQSQSTRFNPSLDTLFAFAKAVGTPVTSFF